MPSYLYYFGSDFVYLAVPHVHFNPFQTMEYLVFFSGFARRIYSAEENLPDWNGLMVAVGRALELFSCILAAALAPGNFLAPSQAPVPFLTPTNILFS